MSSYQKEYELLHDIRKIQRPRTGSYDTLEQNHLSILHDPQLKYDPKVVFPGGLYPPKSKMIQRLNWAFQNPMGTPTTWRTDGYIEEDMGFKDPNRGKVTNRTFILCSLLFILVLALVTYMTYRLLLNGYCRYRYNRISAIEEKESRERKGRNWYDSICMRITGTRRRPSEGFSISRSV